jgi:hypothetical protein
VFALLVAAPFKFDPVEFVAGKNLSGTDFDSFSCPKGAIHGSNASKRHVKCLFLVPVHPLFSP